MSVDRAKLRRLLDAATPRPWNVVDTPWGDGTWAVAGGPDPHGCPMVFSCDEWQREESANAAEVLAGADDDAELLAETVNSVEELLDLIEAAEARIAELERRRP